MIDSQARKILRRLRRHIPIPIMTKMVPAPTLRRIAEHEAAHVIVGMFAGASPLFAHVGRALGGVDLTGGSHAHNDGMFMAYGPITTALAVAGMVNDREDKIGPVDALMLFQRMTIMPQIGPYPSQRPRQVNAEIKRAKKAARRILREHRAAVEKVADALEQRGSLLGADIRRIARKASPSLPAPDAPYRKIASEWDRAIVGDERSDRVQTAMARIESVGLGDLMRLIRQEMASKAPGDARPTRDGARRPARVA